MLTNTPDALSNDGLWTVLTLRLCQDFDRTPMKTIFTEVRRLRAESACLKAAYSDLDVEAILRDRLALAA